MAENDQNNGNGNGSGEAPVALTAEQITSIINSAITSHLKRLPDPSKIVEEKIAAALKDFKPATSESSDDKSKSGKQDPQVAALMAKLEEQGRAYQQAVEAADAARRQQREDRALADLRGALAGKVRPEIVDDVASLMFHVKKMVEIDEQGNALLKVRRAPAPGFAEEDTLMPIADGVDHWSKSKAAAAYIPAAPPAGGQAQGQSRGSRMPSPQQAPSGQVPKFQGPAKTDREKIQRAMAVEAAIRARQGGQGT